MELEDGMQFSFEVDPSLDVAIGLEADFINEDGNGDLSETLDESSAIIPTEAKPGSEDKVKMLSARYAAGVPLWHDEDCYDHGPDNLGGDFDSEDYEIEDED